MVESLKWFDGRFKNDNEGTLHVSRTMRQNVIGVNHAVAGLQTRWFLIILV